MSSLDVKLKTSVSTPKKIETQSPTKVEGEKQIIFSISKEIKEFWIYTGTHSSSPSPVLSPAPFILEALKDAIVGAFRWIIERIWELIETVIDLVLGGIEILSRRFLGGGLLGIVGRIYDFFIGLIARGLRFVVGQLRRAYRSILAGDIEGALKSIMPFVAIGFGIQTMLDLSSTKLKGSGAELFGMRSFIDGLFSPSLIGGAFVGALFGASVHTPLSYIANKIFEPTQPSIRDAWEMWLRRKLTNVELDEVFKFHGYQGKYRAGYHAFFWSHPPMSMNVKLLLRKKITKSAFLEWSRWSSYPEHVANLLVQAAYRVPSIFYIARITRTVYIPDQTLKKLMYDLEYPDYIIPYVLAWIRRGAIEDEIVRLATEYMYLHQYGWLVDADLKEKLERLKLQKEEIVLRVEHAKWRFARQILSEKRDMFIYQFRAIAEPTEEDADKLYENLVGIGLRDEMANVLTNQERVKAGMPIKEYVAVS